MLYKVMAAGKWSSSHDLLFPNPINIGGPILMVGNSNSTPFNELWLTSTSEAC